ncbi:hypothetical protein K435DRAFT_355760 [Dendrothele bispora CBS 962.96]|uniref:Uncharacterized protein n=1 Tax=Dendrothele bispora (strain CBS 962.96) TaxID=1314807 RepID=A0A4S8LE75_DENBC|nr:hypothetical protein K435DRAFT_355760 [Dendrothele bispora CBS 962.96]
MESAPLAVVAGSPLQTAVKATTRRHVSVIPGSQLPSRHSRILGGRQQARIKNNGRSTDDLGKLSIQLPYASIERTCLDK